MGVGEDSVGSRSAPVVIHVPCRFAVYLRSSRHQQRGSALRGGARSPTETSGVEALGRLPKIQPVAEAGRYRMAISHGDPIPRDELLRQSGIEEGKGGAHFRAAGQSGASAMR